MLRQLESSSLRQLRRNRLKRSIEPYERLAEYCPIINFTPICLKRLRPPLSQAGSHPQELHLLSHGIAGLADAFFQGSSSMPTKRVEDLAHIEKLSRCAVGAGIYRRPAHRRSRAPSSPDRRFPELSGHDRRPTLMSGAASLPQQAVVQRIREIYQGQCSLRRDPHCTGIRASESRCPRR